MFPNKSSLLVNVEPVPNQNTTPLAAALLLVAKIITPFQRQIKHHLYSTHHSAKPPENRCSFKLLLSIYSISWQGFFFFLTNEQI